MAAPLFKWRDLIQQHNVHVRSSNYELYGDMSDRVYRVLKQFSPDVEKYSIDEAFVHLPSFVDPAAIRTAMLKQLGLPVSVGIGPTKTLSKAANYIAKKDARRQGVYAPDDTEWDNVLAHIPIKQVWGIGYRWARRMTQLNIKTARDLRDKEPTLIKKKFNVVAERIVRELCGTQCIELDDIAQDRKNAACTRSFGQPLTDLADIRKAIAFFCSTLGTRIRDDGQLTTHVSVFLSTGRFSKGERLHRTHSALLPEPTDNTQLLAQYAYASLDTLFRPGLRYKQAGVFLSGLIDNNAQQFDLFVNRNHERETSLMQALDAINYRYGRGKVKIAAEGTDPSWVMKQAWLSDKYTTRWNELKTVM